MVYLCTGIALPWALYLCYMDYRYQRLPNKATIPAGLISIVLAIFYHPSALWGGILWWILYLFIPVGGGDRKLSISLGIILCYRTGFLGLLLGIGGAALFTLISIACSSLSYYIFSSQDSRKLHKGSIVPASTTEQSVIDNPLNKPHAHGPSMLISTALILLLF